VTTLLVLVGCAPPVPGPPGTPDGRDDTALTDSTGTPAAVVVDLRASAPYGPHAVELSVDLDHAAPLVAACVHPEDPAEVHLVESPTPATRHVVRLAGLLAETSYRCVAADPAASGPPAEVVHLTGADPGDLARMAVTDTGAHAGGYVLLNVSNDCDWYTALLVVVDRQARARWVYRIDEPIGPSLEFRTDGADAFVYGGGWPPASYGRPRRVDVWGETLADVADVLPDAATSGFHHDGKRLADGRYLTLEAETVDGPTQSFTGFRVRAVDLESGTVDLDWRSQRAVDEGWLPEGEGDAWHANWVDLVGDELLVSLCHLSLTVAVDPASGEHLWSFGPGGDFTPQDEDGTPLGDDAFPECQHGNERLGDSLLVYDNGRTRTWSQVVSWRLDLDARVATREWSWTEPGWWEYALGDVDRLPGGQVLVTQGHGDCISATTDFTTRVVELVGDEVVWRLAFEAGDQMAYRAEVADGCTLFANAAECPQVAARVAALPALGLQ